MLKTPPQFDPGNGDTTATLISGNTEFTIPALADGVLPKYVMITVDLVTAVHFTEGVVSCALLLEDPSPRSIAV